MRSLRGWLGEPTAEEAEEAEVGEGEGGDTGTALLPLPEGHELLSLPGGGAAEMRVEAEVRQLQAEVSAAPELLVWQTSTHLAPPRPTAA